ncbi:hypothetical protein BC829DRAFT_214874 [Chytridium lagenaria]|nr:hypothetical protein BC829DRAFT_214874 [Chytridium lagenaria]
MIENLANGGGGQILTFSKPATTVSLLSRLPLHIDPYTPGRNWFYFEVTIMEITISPNPTVISIGLATKPYPPFVTLAGTNTLSVTTLTMVSSPFLLHPLPIAPLTVTNPRFLIRPRLPRRPLWRPPLCHLLHPRRHHWMRVDPNRGAVFYTLNGTHLGDGSLSNTYRDYHVAVAADGPCQVYVNVGGKPFLYSSANVGCFEEREVKV